MFRISHNLSGEQYNPATYKKIEMIAKSTGMTD